MASFKFQTSGQSLDVVPVYDYVIQGLTLKPATPSDAKIFRDAQNNALIQWRRRGRINHHWRDRAGVPVSEETEYYEIEVLSGATVVRTVRVDANEAQPVQWAELKNGERPTIASDGSGTVYHPAAGTAESTFYGIQRMDGDFILEFETYNSGSSLWALPDIVGIANGSGVFDVAWLGTVISPLISTATGVSASYASGDKFVMEYIGGLVKYYKNPQNEHSPVMSFQLTSLDFPYRVYVQCRLGSDIGIRNAKVLRFTTADWSYTANMQTADGLTPGSPIHLKIYQVSAQVGRGIPLEVTL